MAKIDITKIPGYKDELSADEKIKLLSGYEIPDPDYAGYVKKEIFDRTASEVADWKKKHNALLSEEERKASERADELKKMQDELETLKKERAVSESKSKYLALGYDEKLADETAKAFANGDMEKVFSNMAIHIENVKKATAASTVAGDPKPAAGGKQEPPKGERAKLIEQYNEAEKRGDFVLCQALQAQIHALPKE